MAEYDLTQKLILHLDRHLAIPLLTHLSDIAIFPPEQLAKAQCVAPSCFERTERGLMVTSPGMISSKAPIWWITSRGYMSSSKRTV